MNKQKGFVQGALLIGIALLAIVIGAFAMASNNNTSDISKEKTKTNAAVVVKKMADLSEAFQIAVAQDGAAAGYRALTGSAPVDVNNVYGIDYTQSTGLIAKTSWPQGSGNNMTDGGAGWEPEYDHDTSPNFVRSSRISISTTPEICAQINRVLGLASAGDTDDQVFAKVGLSHEWVGGHITIHRDEACSKFEDEGEAWYSYDRFITKQ